MIAQVATFTDQPVGVRKIDAFRGALDGSVSSQWHARPDDQRFLSLDALYEAVQQRRERSTAAVINTKDLSFGSDLDDDNQLWLQHKDGRRLIPNHWSFGQMCSRVGAPATFIRDKLPAPIAHIVLQTCLVRSQHEHVGILEADRLTDDAELRAITGPDYGRVYDAEVVDVVRRVTDDGTWKVPGMINWRNMTYDPNTPVTKQSTTLYASDRDVFIFLCRDQYPIEVGKLPDGSPDLLFPGFFVSNSETGSRSLSVETMMMRGACMNRNLWGVEQKRSLRMRHTSGLPSRFMLEARPVLEEFSRTSASIVARKVAAAKQRRVGDDDDEVAEFIQKRTDLSRSAARAVLDSVFKDEGHKARSLWDVVQGVTAKARDIPHQDRRIDVERTAGKLMDLVSA